jgi:hypothetical protein
VNLQQYADHRKVLGLRGATHVSVLRAIKNGRLQPPAVERQGKGWEIDPTLADEQWAQATDPAPRGTNASQGQGPRPKAAAPGGQAPTAKQDQQLAKPRPSPKAKAKAETLAGPADPIDGLDDDPDTEKADFYKERALHEREKRLIARMDRMVKAKELAYRADMEIAYNAVLLQLTTLASSAHKRIKAMIPHLTHQELSEIERIISEIFESVSSNEFEELPE